MPYALGQLHNCHHIPPSLPPISPSLPSVPPILNPNPPPVGWGGGVNNNLSIFSAVHDISRTFEMLPPPIPLGTPPPQSGVDQIFFFLVSGQFMTFPGLFIFDPLKPPMPWDPPGVCFTVEPLYLKHASNHNLRIRHYIVLL